MKIEKCHVCGSDEIEEITTDKHFKIEKESILVENIPAQKCVQCGEEFFSKEVVELTRQLIHENKPSSTRTMKVYGFAA
jgi:YgiT-type zinc finger domain-containing protein